MFENRVRHVMVLRAAWEYKGDPSAETNVVITPMYDEARKCAQGEIPDGPLRGVPMVLKDLVAEYAGVRMTEGSALLQDYVSSHDSELGRRYKRAGLIIVGKSNTPELGSLPTTEPQLFGPSRNPWNPNCTTGGSSGGSATAVASGMVPIGHANSDISDGRLKVIARTEAPAVIEKIVPYIGLDESLQDAA